MNNDNHCSSYANHSNANLNNIGITGMESLYVSGVHSFDEMVASNTMKSETPPLAAHHYLAFPVNTTPITYPHSSFLQNCFVNNSNPNVSSCGTTATVAAFGIPVSNASNPIHTTLLDVNPSLPHFNQAFQ